MKKYIHYGHIEFRHDKFNPIVNSSAWSTKPTGGFWASDIKAKYGWKDWCKDEDFRRCDKSNSFTFCLKDDARVLVINSKNDLVNLPKAKNGYAALGWVALDFEALSRNYDAIEANISKDDDLYFALYGWDCDSILIMNPDVVVDKKSI